MRRRRVGVRRSVCDSRVEEEEARAIVLGAPHPVASRARPTHGTLECGSYVRGARGARRVRKTYRTDLAVEAPEEVAHRALLLLGGREQPPLVGGGEAARAVDPVVGAARAREQRGRLGTVTIRFRCYGSMDRTRISIGGVMRIQHHRLARADTLVVRVSWLSLLASGDKTLEIRACSTAKRGRVYLEHGDVRVDRA